MASAQYYQSFYVRKIEKLGQSKICMSVDFQVVGEFIFNSSRDNFFTFSVNCVRKMLMILAPKLIQFVRFFATRLL